MKTACAHCDGFCLSLGVSICLNVVSIETLNLDTGKKVSLDGQENLDS